MSLTECRVCECTEANCTACVEKTGRPCRWVEDDLCSACVALDAAHALKMGPLPLKRLAELVGVNALVINSVLREFAVHGPAFFTVAGGEWVLSSLGYEKLLEA